MCVILLLILLGLFIYYHGIKTFNHFQERGVKFINPLPYFGNTIQSSIFYRKHLMHSYKDIYKKANNEDFIGFFENKTPILMLKNPQIIQTILVKDFDYFYDRREELNGDIDPLFAYNLANLRGKPWKLMRQKLTPVFSSGKLKMMFNHFDVCSVELTNMFKNMLVAGRVINVGESVRKYGLDVIGTCVYGLQLNAMKDPESQFNKLSRAVFKKPFGANIKSFLEAIQSKLPDLLRIAVFKRDYHDFFLNFTKDTMKFREENNIERNDFIQILMNLVKDEAVTSQNNNNINEVSKNLDNNSDKTKFGTEIVLNDELLAATTFTFFLGGFETSSSTIRNCLLELSFSHNQAIQEKLREEILVTIAKHNNEITYETVKDMEYMDCVISESLRKYPILPLLLRVCTKDYNIPGTSVIIKKGEKVMVPVYSLHHDPQYYPDPDVFDPERFNYENKRKRPNFTYLPFGEGPRTCFAKRFALLQIKVSLTRILTNFEVSFNSETKLPLTWDPKRTMFIPQQKIILNFKSIKEKLYVNV